MIENFYGTYMEVISNNDYDLGGPQKDPHGFLKAPQGPPCTMIGNCQTPGAAQENFSN